MFRLRPSLTIIFFYLLAIAIGTLVLSLPVATAGGQPLKLIDAIFTASSAICNTALLTVDLGKTFSLVGQLVILFLIQLGGLAYMTLSTFILLVFRQKLFISPKLSLREALNLYSLEDVLFVFNRIISVIFLIEGIGTLIIFLRYLPSMGVKQALFQGLFLAVSAFNNAGLSLLPAASFANDWLVIPTLSILIIFGGLGFIVIADIFQNRRLSLHSKLVILTTLGLILVGTLAIFGLEYNNPSTLGNLNMPNKILASFFQSVNARTAGFGTMSMLTVMPATTLLIMFFMFIGASPGGTGGGIKTTTFALVLSTIWATLRGYKNTIFYNRRVPADTIRQSFTITILALLIITVAVFALSQSEKTGIVPITFEVVSAFSCVGLSIGLVSSFSPLGKLLITVVMFIGRVGLLTLLLSLYMGQKEPRIEPPKEGISIG